MSHIIIGVHGLANKPKEHILASGWEKAICEGLYNVCKLEERPAINFAMGYWADIFYKNFDNNPDNAYKPVSETEHPLQNSREHFLDAIRGWVGDKLENPVEYLKNHGLLDDAADKVLERYLQDLDGYYEDAVRRDKTRNRVMELIKDNQQRRILLIGHSMGSIITYDVLRILGQQDKNNIVDHYVTIGSPLGLPHVQAKIITEFGSLRSPSVVKKWTNFADRRDPVALDSHLRRDFRPNAMGIRPEDDLVMNDWGGIYHKSYGYLRCPELSEQIQQFM